MFNNSCLKILPLPEMIHSILKHSIYINYGLDMVSGVNAGSVWDHLSLACDLRLMSFGLRDSIGSSVHHLAVLLAWEGLALRTRVTAAATGIVQQWHGSQNPILRGS